jgi:hypothetical protein
VRLGKARLARGQPKRALLDAGGGLDDPHASGSRGWGTKWQRPRPGPPLRCRGCEGRRRRWAAQDKDGEAEVARGVELGAPSAPPESLTTRWVTPRRRNVSASAAGSKGGRATTKPPGKGNGASGRSITRRWTARARRPAQAGSDWRPVARKTVASGGIRQAAPASSATKVQRSLGPGDQPGRSSRRSGSPRAAQIAWVRTVTREAKGWVASMTAWTEVVSRNASKPASPPKPPWRVGGPASRARGCAGERGEGRDAASGDPGEAPRL